ncbi:hypothetical protein [Kingella denitrificans]|uniref:hypothetical protein n=1 Tax=Kingella denitrificans TaxID=502 RepID=UPI001FD10A31|nr:hypothetical protein [Kingella denitrificans]
MPAEQPISAAKQAVIDEMAKFHRMPLDFDETQQTYVTQRFLQCGQRDFTAKTSQKYPKLRVLKYRSSVFYENRFNDALLEMRGLVVDAHGRIIVRPFKKVFNYSERIAKNSKYPIEISENHLVDAVVKVNGFLGVCTHVRLPEDHPSFGAAFQGKTLYSTTGSLDSGFAEMVQNHCSRYENIFMETFAKKPFPRQPKPKHRFSAVSAPQYLLILPKYPLNPPLIPDNKASGPPFRRQQAHLAC